MARTARRQGARQHHKRRSSRARSAPLAQMNFNAAGIDVGATEHWVAVPEDRDEEPVRRFGAFTADLYALADWLRQCQIETVVLESTGRMVKIFELACLLEVTLLPSPTLRLVFRPLILDTHRQDERPRLRRQGNGLETPAGVYHGDCRSGTAAPQ